jgi:hypothetical protein
VHRAVSLEENFDFAEFVIGEKPVDVFLLLLQSFVVAFQTSLPLFDVELISDFRFPVESDGFDDFR